MSTTTPFPTISAGGFSAYVDFVAYASTEWGAELHAVSLFGHKTAVEAIRVRLRMGEIATLTITHNRNAHLMSPETCVSRTRRTGEVTHVTVLPTPQSFSAQSFLILVRDEEDPVPRFHRACDGLITTPLHPSWAPWLWQWALQSGCLHALESVGCRAWQGSVDELQLEAALQVALETGVLCIPVSASVR
jgi:hypothetical protein